MKLKFSEASRILTTQWSGCLGPRDDCPSLGFPSSIPETSIQGQVVYQGGEENTGTGVGKQFREGSQ